MPGLANVPESARGKDHDHLQEYCLSVTYELPTRTVMAGTHVKMGTNDRLVVPASL